MARGAVVERSARIFWEYGNLTCKMYPLAELDYRHPTAADAASGAAFDGVDGKGALQLIIEGAGSGRSQREGHLELLKARAERAAPHHNARRTR